MSRANVDSEFESKMNKTLQTNKKISSNDLNLIHYITSLYGNTLSARGLNLLDPIYANMFYYNKLRSRPLTDLPYVTRTYAFFTRPECNFSFENINSVPFFKWLYSKPIGKMVMSMLTDPDYYLNAPGAINANSGDKGYREQIRQIIAKMNKDLATKDSSFGDVISSSEQTPKGETEDDASAVNNLNSIPIDSLSDDSALETLMNASSGLGSKFNEYITEANKYYDQILTWNKNITDADKITDKSIVKASQVMLYSHKSQYDTFNFTSPFIPLLMNTCTSVTGAKDLNLQSYEYEEDEFSSKQNVATGMDDLWSPGTLNTSFEDIAYGPVGLLFMLWEFYIHYVSRGYIASTREHVTERILDYTCSIYVFVIGPDGRTIERFGKYTGCYPTSFPLSQQLEHNSEIDPLMLHKINISWNYNRYEPMNPEILTDFNFVSETEWLFKLKNWDRMYDRKSQLDKDAFLDYLNGRYKTMSEFEKEAIHRAGRREQLWELVHDPGMSGKVPRALINGTGISTVNDLSRSDLVSDIWGGYPTIVNGKELIWVLPQWDDTSAKHDRGNRDDNTIPDKLSN